MKVCDVIKICLKGKEVGKITSIKEMDNGRILMTLHIKLYCHTDRASVIDVELIIPKLLCIQFLFGRLFMYSYPF